MSFIDTNVLVHATVKDAPCFSQARAALSRMRASGRVAVSRQILREYLVARTRPQSWQVAAPLAEAVADVEAIRRRFDMLDDGADVWTRLLSLGAVSAFGGKQVHDANIVATMLAHGESTLLTFNERDFRRFGSLIQVVVP